jgi:hypothetical protein
MSAYTGSAYQQRGSVQTRAELEALIRNREVLSDQLERVTQQRGELAQQRLNAEARANSSTDPSLDRRLMREYEQQINELGTRSGQLQRQIATADEQIASAAAQGVGGGSEGSPVTTSVISVPSQDFSAREALLRDRYESMMIAEGAGLILVCVMVGRIMWRRAQRRASTLFASAADVTGMKLAIDTIAVEVERISENQRYATKLLQERAEPMARFESAPGSMVEQRRAEPPAR